MPCLPPQAMIAPDSGHGNNRLCRYDRTFYKSDFGHDIQTRTNQRLAGAACSTALPPMPRQRAFALPDLHGPGADRHRQGYSRTGQDGLVPGLFRLQVHALFGLQRHRFPVIR